MHSGQQIRDYVLDSKIGEGGMGQVWRAHHQVLDRKVAIKAMAAHVAADPDFEHRFIQEAKAQANLSHPRILGVNEFFIHDEVYYLVMPLVEGESLEARLERLAGPLPVARALEVARDLLDALDYAHQRGIIHRDVKPSNVLIDADGRAYLMDFGIALLVGQDRKTRTGTLLGTPYYMSPEQIRTPRSIDHRTDVYSVGCMLYEMLTGRPPFLPKTEGDTDFQVKEAHLYEHPEPVHRLNPEVPEGVSNLVAKAMVKEPSERFAGCGEFLRALHAYEYQGVVMPPPLPPPQTGRTTPLGTTPARPTPVPPPPAHPTPAPVAPTHPTPAPVQTLLQQAPARKPRRMLWFLFGGGAAGCLLLVALVALVIWIGNEQSYDPPPIDSSGFADPPPTTTDTGTGTGSEPIPQEQLDDYYRSEIEGLMALRTPLYAAQGYSKTHDLWVDRLEANGSGSLEFNLEAGVEHVVLAVCDSDCNDVDLVLYDENDHEIDRDSASDDIPIVSVTPSWSGGFNLEVKMHECGTSYCYYGVVIYGRSGP